MQSISAFIEDFRDELNRQSLACDSERARQAKKLDAKTMFIAIVQMIAQRNGNFQSLSNTMNIIGTELDFSFAASSFCDARKPYSPYIFVDLSQWIYDYLATKLKKTKWFGRPIFAIDSTTLRLPRELMNEGFGHENSNSFHPLAMLTVLYDLRLGMVYDSIVSQHKSERINASHLFQGVPEGSLVIGDRGFFSFELLHEARKNKFDILFRIAAASAPEEIREFANSEKKEDIITVTPSIPTERKLTNRGYTGEPLEVRVLKQTIGKTPYLLVTTLLDRSIKKHDFFGLYHSRWDIEEFFKLIKSELKLESFKTKHTNGVLQEIFATLFLTNFSNALIGLERGAKNKHFRRKTTSVLAVVRMVRDCFVSLMIGAKRSIRRIDEALRSGITKCCTNFRAGRVYPRNHWSEPNPWTRYAKGIRR